MKKNNQQSEDAGVMQQFAQLREVLATTTREIPALLAQEQTLSRAAGLNEGEESQKQLEDVAQQRQAAVRRRSAAVVAIMELEGPLQAARAAAVTQRQAYTAEAVAAFQARYEAAVAALQQLWEEGRVLAETLKVQVPMPLPVRVVTSVVDSVARAQPILADVHVAVDAEAARLGARMDELDGALSLIGAMRQADHQDERHRRLCLERRTSGEMASTYVVVKPLTHLGTNFERGALVDQSVIPVSALARFLVSHYIVQAADRPAAA